MPDDDFTADPDLLESDRTLGRMPLSQAEEPGRQPGRPTEAVLVPCPGCGRPVILGLTAAGTLAPVEPETRTYTLTWERGARWPRLCQSRGYPAHTCPG